MKKAVVTGFQPFGGESINPAWEAVKKMRDVIADAVILKVEVPVEYDRGAAVIYEVMKQEQPDVVISIGQAGGRTAITPERIAVNMQDAGAPDNAQVLRTEHLIYEDGPDAYFSKLPVKKIEKAVREAGIPCSISNTAGLYVCNDVMYHVLYWIDKEFPDMKGGFIHVPYTTQQVLNKPGQPSMPLEMITRALETAVEAVLKVM